MHAMNREQGAPEGPVPDSSSVAVALDQRLGTVQSFANAMTENILHSVVNRLEKTQSGEDRSACSDASDLEKPLASATTEATVREACRGPMPRHTSSSPNTEMEMEVSSDAPSDPPLQNPAIQASARARRHHPSLSQSGLPAAGSLDYPDAPPTTPLLPELTRSRESFARKLKGGLAKEFSPSPPPSTPKNEENKAEGLMMTDESQAAADADARIDFVKRLVVSLSAGAGEGGGEWRERPAGGAPDSYGGEGVVAGPPGRLEMAVFAEVLSGEIIDWVTNHYPSLVGGGFTEQAEGDGDIQCLADRLAETIISSTMRDVTMHV